MRDEDTIRMGFELLRPNLSEQGRRLYAAAQVVALGNRSLAAVSRATGIARSTIGRGLRDIEQINNISSGRVRRPGGGRKSITHEQPTILSDLKQLVEPITLGDPERALYWVSKSKEKLARALREMGHKVGSTTVGVLLKELGYSRQGNFKANEGHQHADRDAQFEHINTKVLSYQKDGHPVISVDTKKKELVGNYKNGGTDLRPKKRPRRVNGHDFPDKTLGKAVPYGVYDISANAGWVSVGINHDTAQFAVQSIRRWLELLGRERYPTMRRLLITADGGGSNGVRVRLWKLELQKLADETGLTLDVCHYPPGTSKWNKIEHRLFCHISQNWRARPLTSLLAVVKLISSTTTTAGLKVACELDNNFYPKGIKVSDEEMEALAITGDEFHPEWNYSLEPRKRK